MKGVPSDVTVTPVTPGGASDSGIDVFEGTTKNGVLLITVVEIGATGGEEGSGNIGIFVELGKTKNGVLPECKISWLA
jgi:hypothetical protein